MNTDHIEIARAEAVTSRLVLAFDADDLDSYAVALNEVLSDAQLTASVIATLVHTLCVAFTPYTGWRERTAAELARLLDELAGP